MSMSKCSSCGGELGNPQAEEDGKPFAKCQKCGDKQYLQSPKVENPKEPPKDETVPPENKEPPIIDEAPKTEKKDRELGQEDEKSKKKGILEKIQDFADSSITF